MLFADAWPGYLVNLCPMAPPPSPPPPCTSDAWNKVGGTSASTPLVAGALALIGQQAGSRDQPPLGFPAPLLYALAADDAARSTVFRDVVEGDNDIFAVGCCSAGPDYDRASGWGSVDFGRLGDALASPLAVLAGPARVTVGDPVAFDAGGSTTTYGTLIRYRWDVDGDGAADEVTTAPTFTTTFGDAGAHTVTVTVVDSQGRSSTANHAVGVLDRAGPSVARRPTFTG